jgi:membrane protein YqaA with SNARE-associated domain
MESHLDSAVDSTDVIAESASVALATPVARRRVAVRARVRVLLARFHDWAETGWATSAIGVWAFLQASVVPGPVESFFVPLALADRKRVWRFALSAIIGSSLGALVSFGIGRFAFDSVGVPILGALGFGLDDVEQSRALFASHGWMLVVLSTVTPISLKLTSIAAGAFGVPFFHFALAVFAGRTVRFVATAAVILYAGEKLSRRAERRRAERRAAGRLF